MPAGHKKDKEKIKEELNKALKEAKENLKVAKQLLLKLLKPSLLLVLILIIIPTLAPLLVWRFDVKYLEDMLTGGHTLAKETVEAKVDGLSIHLCTATIPLDLIRWDQLADKLLSLLHTPALLTSVNNGSKTVLVADPTSKAEGLSRAQLCPPPITNALDNCTPTPCVYVRSRNLSIEFKSIDHIRIPLVLNGTPIERITLVGTDYQGRTVGVEVEFTAIPKPLLGDMLWFALAVYLMVGALLYTALAFEASETAEEQLATPTELLIRDYLSLLGRHRITLLAVPYIALSTLQFLAALALFVNDNVIGNVALSFLFIAAFATLVVLSLAVIASTISIFPDISRQVKGSHRIPIWRRTLALVTLVAIITGVTYYILIYHVLEVIIANAVMIIMTAYAAEPLKTLLTAAAPVASSLLAPAVRALSRREELVAEPRIVLTLTYLVVTLTLLAPLLNLSRWNMYKCHEDIPAALLATTTFLAMLAVGVSLSNLLDKAKKPEARAYLLGLTLLILAPGFTVALKFGTDVLAPALTVSLYYAYPLLLILILRRLAWARHKQVASQHGHL